MNDITRRDAVKVTAAIAGLGAAAAASGTSVLAQEPAKATTNRVETDSLGPGQRFERQALGSRDAALAGTFQHWR
jgi:hypothetical protein